jgi:uncharacterized protein with GYD domain
MQTLVIDTVPIPEAPDDATLGPHLKVNVAPGGEVKVRLMVLYADGVDSIGRFVTS